MAADRAPVTILFVYAHVADAACEASGTAAIQADLGDRVLFAITSDGERHHASMFLDADEAPARGDVPFVTATLDQIRALKRREARRAAAILGVDEVIFLGWEDEAIAPSEPRVDALTALLLRTRPDVVVTHLPHHTYGPEVDPHAAVGSMILRARERATSRIRQVDGVPLHHVKEFLFFPQGELADSRDLLNPGLVADVWIDITPVVDRKVRAMDQIVSQNYHGRTARKIIESREGRWGMLSGVSYAEPFIRGGRTYSSIPLPESVLAREFVPNDLPGDLLATSGIPDASPPDAYELPPTEH